MITNGQNQITQVSQSAKEAISGVLVDSSKLIDMERSFNEGVKSHVNPSKAELDALMASFNQGLVERAKSLAQNLITRSPKHGTAWKVLGVIYQQEEALEEAEFALKKAAELAPKDAEAHYNLANFYFDQHELKAAQTHYLRAVKLVPNFAKANFNLANVLKELGQFSQAEIYYKKGIKLEDTHATMYLHLAEVIASQHRHKEAVTYYKKALALNPKETQALLKLGITYLTLNRIEEAIESLSAVIAIDADNASAHNALGLAYKTHRQDKVAERHFKRAIEIRPDYIPPLKNLGLLYKEMGQTKEAEACYMKVLSLETPTAETLNNLAVVLMSQGRYPEAEIQCRKALELIPTLGDAWNNLGLILQARMVNQEAEAAFEQAIKFQPNDVKTLVNYSVTLKILGKLTKAEACLKKAIKLDDQDANAYVNLGMTYLDQGLIEEAVATTKRAIEVSPKNLDAYDNLLFAMEYSEQYSIENRIEVAKQYGHILAENAKPYTHWQAEASPTRLRVGIVSGDLRQHPVAYFLKNAIQHLDLNKVELFAYSTDGREDATTAQLKPYFASWKSLAGHHDAGAAQLIYQDNIHVLLDLSGHTGGNKLPVFAWKPAPVQASWLGYWATTGVETIDYVLADEVGVPLQQQARFTETIKYLPQTRMCFTAPNTDLAVAPLPALDNGFITFGCFQNITKVSDEVLTLWAEVMRAVPTSRLRWQCKAFVDDEVIASIKSRLMACGMEPERVSFHGKVSREAYLAAYAEVDLVLDSFPFPGGTTTCEALWMGVPTLTLAGSSMIARQGASLLTAAGLADWVVEKREDFVKQARLMVADVTVLAKLRKHLRAKVQASALFNGALFANNLMAVLWEMWLEKQPVQAKTLASSSKAAAVNTDHDQHSNAHQSQVLVQVISATRMSEQDFWARSALGRSLNRHLKQDARLSASIAFNNTRGLSTIFNACIENAEEDAVLVFIHDDVWIDEEQFADVVLAGLQQFDVIGVAGNKRRVANQPAWPFIDADFTWDSKENLSGRVAHGEHAFGQISDYGAVPASCELLDGVFLAAKKRTLVAKQVMFDDQFDFHFYDLDFCRTAKKAGLTLGTWAVSLTHQSAGAFGSELWKHHYLGYLRKWEGDLSFLNKAYEKVEVKLFELGTVDEVAEHFQAVTLLPEMEYETPVVPIYGAPCVNAAVTQSHLLKHPAVYVAPVDDYQMIGSAAFPIIHQKSIRHQYFSPDIWETSEQGLGYCRIREEKNLIGYAQLVGEAMHQSKVINLVGNGSSNYAHWLTEFLPQIVLLINAGVDISEYQILVDANSFPSMLEALYLIGVKKEQLVMIEPMSLNSFPEALWVSPVANVVFQRPNALHGVGKDMLSQPQHAIFHPLALCAVRETYLSCIESPSDTTPPNKIFIKRTSSRVANLRMMVNEQAIEALLVANGFTSIDPSRLTFMQQVALFSQAEYIVSASGAALVNMLWAPEGANVLVLMNDTKYANYWYFSNIAACVGLHLRYVLGKTLPSKQCTDLHHADFEISADAVLTALSDAGLSDLKNPQAELEQALFEVLALAIEHQNTGNIEAAKQLYHEILKVAPQHALANHHLGVIEAHQHSPKVALPRLELAVQTQPENEQFWVSYIDALAMAGEVDQLSHALELGQQLGLTTAMATSLKAEFSQILANCASSQTQMNRQQHQPVATICTLIPAYKPDYLEALLLSLSTQTYRQFKVIISDDNPSDEVTKTVKQLQLKGLLKGLSVELVAGPKKGGFANIYHLVRTYAQQAKFFHILMDDDLIYPTFYETHMRAHASTQAQFSMSARWTASESGQPYLQSMDATTSQYFSQQFTAQAIAKALIPSCNNKLGEWSHAVFRNSAAETILNPSIANMSYFGLDDIGSFIHAAQAEPGVWIPESLGIFRTNPHQNTGKIENATIKCAHYGWIALALIALEKHWITEAEAWSGISLIRETIRARYAKEALGQQMLAVLDAYPYYQPAFKQAFLSVWNAYLGEIRIAEILQGDLSIKLL